jgi:hypothetical protein
MRCALFHSGFFFWLWAGSFHPDFQRFIVLLSPCWNIGIYEGVNFSFILFIPMSTDVRQFGACNIVG